MIWFLYLPLSIFFMLFCWLINWIVVFFSNKEGELPKFLRYFQTWDSSLDSEFFCTDVVPKKYSLIKYDFYEKYEVYQDKETLKQYGYAIDKVKLIGNFSLKEKIKRYFCRLLWIMRNPAYGFSFYILGVHGDKANIEFLKRIDTEDREFIFAWDKSKNILIRPWTLRLYQHIIGKLYITAYLGWKIPWWTNADKYKCMIAYRLVPRFKARNEE